MDYGTAKCLRTSAKRLITGIETWTRENKNETKMSAFQLRNNMLDKAYSDYHI